MVVCSRSTSVPDRIFLDATRVGSNNEFTTARSASEDRFRRWAVVHEVDDGPEVRSGAFDNGIALSNRSCGCRKRVRLRDDYGRSLLPEGVNGSGRVEAGVFGMDWPLSGWLRRLGGTR
jgi:hypothetical protein